MSDHEKLEFKHSKSVSETYHLTVPGDVIWANITINSIGDLNIQSDYGNYNYAWRSFGDNFKKFLIRICSRCAEHPTGYLYDKLYNHEKANRVDIKRTVARWKEEIIRLRKETRDRWKYLPSKHDVTPEKAREAFDELNSLVREQGSETSQDYFFMWIDRYAPTVCDLLDFEWRMYEFSTTGDKACEALCAQIMPAFADILRKELEQEAAAQKESA